MRRMSPEELVAHIAAIERQCSTTETSAIAAEQARALQYYLQQPFGTEEEGRSQVVSSDVWDVVEGMTPMILAPFVSNDDVVRFNAEGPEDEEAAQQETDYVNYVVTQKNDVFNTLVEWVKTGLLQKNGTVKWWWDRRRRARIERYEGLSDDVYAALIADDRVSVVAHTERVEQGPEGEMVSHDVELRVSDEFGEARYAVVPPEELRIPRGMRGTNLAEAPFVQHVTRKTLSELREMGYDVPDDISDAGTEDPQDSEVYQARTSHEEDTNRFDAGNDPAMREVLYRETYLRVDTDGDGKAELRKVCLVGSTILADEETEEIPFASWTPYPQPFRFHGRCPADEATEIQLLKSTLLRQTFDNIYTANNNRQYVSGKVNMNDLLDNQIAGIVRVGEPGDEVIDVRAHVMPAPVTPLGGVTLPIVEYIDRAAETRLGFSRYNQGTDADSLNKTATGVRIIKQAGDQRVGMIARCFAEQGLRALMLGVHGLLRRHQDRREVMRLRGKWVDVDPRAWRTRYDMSVSVGLGNADLQMRMQAAQLLIETQLRLGPLGLVEPQHLYQSASNLAQAVGEKSPEKFFKSPEDQPPQEQQPDPSKDPAFLLKLAEHELEQMKLQLAEREVAVKERAEERAGAEAQADAALKAQQQGMDMRLELFDALATLQQQFARMEQAQMEMMQRMQGMPQPGQPEMPPEMPMPEGGPLPQVDIPPDQGNPMGDAYGPA